MRKSIAALAALAVPLAPAMAQDGDNPQDHYYAKAAEQGGEANPWLVILPGGGGIEVFGDEHFYFDVAERWSRAGFDTLVVHYQAAAPLLSDVPQGPPGPMEAAVVADALEAAGENGWLDLQCPGFVMGFSMGGAGTMTLAANLPEANLAGAIGFYPMLVGQPNPFAAKVPVLILQGELDEFTTLPMLTSFHDTVINPEQVRVIVYDDAQHGFDIPSLQEPVEYQGGTFQYQQEAAEASTLEVNRFAQRVLADNPGPEGCARGHG